MTIINFVPLLIWMLCFPITIAVEEKITGRTPTPSAGEGQGMWYVVGTLGWFVIGICLS